MKKLLSILLLPVLFFSCNEIEENNFKTSTNSITQDISVSVVQSGQNIVLEEFTAWACNNCPNAAKKLKELCKQNPNLIPIAIHSGNLAKPSKSNNYLSLVTAYGEQLASHFGVNAYPAGVINRSTTPLQYSNWESAIITEIASLPHILNIGLGLKEEANSLLVGVELYFLQDHYQNLLLSLVVLEDNIVGVQLNGSTKEESYVFENVLRQNALIDLPVNMESVRSGDKIKNNYSIGIDPVWDLSNCRVVAIVTNQQSGRVVQAYEIKVRS